MRCRKVRFYLSAYCRDELDGAKRLEIDKHLSGCAMCRKEEAVHRLIGENIEDQPALKVSDNFNANLLNRIGQERFAETRTKAYMPKAIPFPLWAKITPAVATLSLILFVTLTYFSPLQRDNNLIDRFASVTTTNNLDDSYQTVQPVNNPNMIETVDHNWSFNNTLARSERVQQIHQNLIAPEGFYQASALTNSSNKNYNRVPYQYRRTQPIIRVYFFQQGKTVKEAAGEY